MPLAIRNQQTIRRDKKDTKSVVVASDSVALPVSCLPSVVNWCATGLLSEQADACLAVAVAGPRRAAAAEPLTRAAWPGVLAGSP